MIVTTALARIVKSVSGIRNENRKNLLRTKSELGWKGSAVTSTFSSRFLIIVSPNRSRCSGQNNAPGNELDPDLNTSQKSPKVVEFPPWAISSKSSRREGKTSRDKLPTSMLYVMTSMLSFSTTLIFEARNRLGFICVRGEREIAVGDDEVEFRGTHEVQI
ncbi:hypothetical protein L1887_27717 [Cichorium endivia]|nr:hypothetical protein L1887_27717 [Cichorium endivia]